ncbi:MAG: hypothetical protein ACFFAS_15115 [Promethearchaeota archaeon]
MKVINSKEKKVLVLSIFVVIISLNLVTSSIVYENPNTDKTNFKYLKIGAQTDDSVQWLDYPSFTVDDGTWYKTESGTDPDDVSAVLDTNEGCANYTIIGDSYSGVIIEEVPLDSTWNLLPNYDNVEPVDVWADPSGILYASHYWDDVSSDQHTRVQWVRDVTMPDDMSDYNITSASFNFYVNASVHADGGNEGINGGIDRPGDWNPTPTYIGKGDYALFFSYISSDSLENNYSMQEWDSAEVNLGDDDEGDMHVVSDILVAADEEELIFNLNRVLAQDTVNHRDFKLILGIEIFCEDNYGQDDDQWDDLFFQNVSLTVEYEKVIDPLTTVSWHQDSDPLDTLIGENETIEVTAANLNFTYRTDRDWTIITGSLNSFIEIDISGSTIGEKILLSNSATSDQEIKPGGFDVTSLVSQVDQWINLSITVSIRDRFGLADNLTITIDDVELWIWYTITFADIQTDYQLLIEGQDRTLSRSHEAVFDETVNVTFVYTNTSGQGIDGADVFLIGEGRNIRMDPISQGAYQTNLTVKPLGLGDKYFKIEASKSLYESQTIEGITISVGKISALIQTVYLNGTDKTSTKTIENLPSGDPLNITIDYVDNRTGNPPIEGATVQLMEGLNVLGNFTEDPTDHYYSFELNTTGKSKGVYYYSITAVKTNCTLDSVQITVLIELKDSQITLYVDGNPTLEDEAIITDAFDTALNISVEFRSSGVHLGSPSQVRFFIGGVPIWDLTEYPAEELYTIIIDVNNDLNETTNSISILAEKDGYALADIDFVILIEDVQTELSVNVSDIIYVPYLSNFSLQFNYTQEGSGTGIDTTFISINWTTYFLYQTAPGQYVLTCNTSGYSPNTLQSLRVIINPPSYEAQSMLIYVQVEEIATDPLTLWINGTQRPDGYEIEVDAYDILNISIEYRSFGVHLGSPSQVRFLVGANPIWTFTEDPANEIYTLMVPVVELNGSIINIRATKSGYNIQEIGFFIYMGNVETSWTILINDENLTDEPFYTIPVGRSLNITIDYRDKFDDFINNASVNINCIDSTLEYEFTEDPLNYYYCIINTSDFIGDVLSPRIIITASKGLALESQYSDKTIFIRKRVMEIIPLDGQFEYNRTAGSSLSIQFQVNDTDFNELVEGLELRYDILSTKGALLTEDNGTYEVSLRNLPAGTYDLDIYVVATDYYGYEKITIRLNVVNPNAAETAFLEMVIQILIIVGIAGAIGFSAYIYAYQKVLKYPKPVRKVRKYKSNLRKRSFKGPEVEPREQSFDSLYQKELGDVGKSIKTKTTDPSIIAKQPLDEALKKPIEDVPKDQ